jgi:RimJ/RimL family protein N-acetyltransferase
MKVRLRHLKESDIWILHHWINDPEIIQYTNAYRPISEMEQKEWFYDTAYFKNNFVFGIEYIAEEKLIGICGLYDFDPVARKAELRLKIGDKRYWRRGLGIASLSLLITYGFQDLNLNKIWLRVLTNNKAAFNLYTKIGFVHEGLLREDMYIKGAYRDLYIMSLLQSEYEYDNDNPNMQK